MPGRRPFASYAALSWPGDGASMAGETRRVAVTLARLLETEREACALAALVTSSLARRAPPFVPLVEQDAAAWDAALLAEGRAHLARAQSLRAADARPGRFELEAAVQAVHCARRETGATTTLLALARGATA